MRALVALLVVVASVVTVPTQPSEAATPPPRTAVESPPLGGPVPPMAPGATPVNVSLAFNMSPIPGDGERPAGVALSLIGKIEPTGAAAPTGTVTVTETDQSEAGCTSMRRGYVAGPVGQTLQIICQVVPQKHGAHTWKLSYAGDGTYAAGSATLSLDIAKARTAIDFSAAEHEGGVRLTAKSTANIALDGSIDFYADREGRWTAIADTGCSGVSVTGLRNPTTTCDTDQDPGVAQRYRVVYTPAADASTDAAQKQITFTTPKSNSTTAFVTDELSPSLTFGDWLDASVTVSTGSGTVDVSSDDNVVCNDVTLSDGVADCAFRPRAGTQTISATYAGDDATNGSTTSSTITATVAKATPTVTVSATSGTTAGDDVTLTAKVTYLTSTSPETTATATPVDGGRVAFTDSAGDALDCDDVTVDDDGQATCTYTPSVGTHTYTATFGGTDDLTEASGQLADFSVDKATPTLSLTIDDDSATVPADTEVTLRATLSAGGGTVTFTDGAFAIDTCTDVTVSAGVATCTLTPAPGTHTFDATSSGDTTTNAARAASTVALTVDAILTTLTLEVDPGGPTAYGTEVVLTARTSDTRATNRIRFFDGTVELTACGTLTGPVATCTITPATGDHAFNATHDASTTSSAATSATVSHTVSAAATNTAVQATNTAAGTLTITATVDVATSGAVRFRVNGTSICDDQPVTVGPGGATATCTWTGDLTSSPQIQAQYLGTADFSASTSPTITFAPPPACTTGTTTLWEQIGAGGPATVGDWTITLAGAYTPCAPTAALGFTADVALYGGTVTGTGLTGTLTTSAGLCLTAGELHLPEAWQAGTATITSPVCVAVTTAATPGTVSSGSATAAGTFPFLGLDATTTVQAAFGPTLGVAVVAGSLARLDLTVAADGAVTGTLTTPGLQLFGRSLADFSATLDGDTLSGEITFTDVAVAEHVTLTTVTLGAGTGGFTVTGTARIGTARPLTLDVTGTIADVDDWTLALAGTGTWQPTPGMTLSGPWTGTLADDWSVTATGGVWQPGTGAQVAIASVQVSGDGTCVTGTLTADQLQVPVTGCVDLVTGVATLTPTGDATLRSLRFAVTISLDPFVISGEADLTPWGLAKTGTITVADGVTRATATVPLPAATAAALGQAGFAVDDQIVLTATVRTGEPVVFTNDAGAPQRFPFLALPAGATLTSGALAIHGDAIRVTATASIPQRGTSAAQARITVDVAADGTLSGTAELTGLVLVGATFDLQGTIGGRAGTVTSTVAATRRATVGGITVETATARLDATGLSLQAELAMGPLEGITANGTIDDLASWSLIARSSATPWNPISAITTSLVLAGTFHQSSSVLTLDLSATTTELGALRYDPAPVIALRFTEVHLANTRGGCAGNVWLRLGGTATLDLFDTTATHDAGGCIDLTTGATSLSSTFESWAVEFLDGSGSLSSPTVTVTGSVVDITATLELDPGFMPAVTLTAQVTVGGGYAVVGARASLGSLLGTLGNELYVYYSNSPVTGFASPYGTIDLVKGITFAASVTLPASVADALGSLGLDRSDGLEVLAVGTYDLVSKAFIFKISSDLGIPGQELFSLESGLKLTFDSVFVKASVSNTNVAFGFGATATLHVPALSDDGVASDVPITGEVSIGLTQFSVSLQAGTCGSGTPGWVDAFGIEGLTVQCAAVQGGVGYGGVPTVNFGMLGEITSLPESLAEVIGYVDGAKLSFAFNVDPLLLSVEIGSSDSDEVVLRPLTVVDAPDLIQVKHAALYVAPEQVTVGQQTFQPGIGLAFRGSIFGVVADVMARVDLTVPSFEAKVDLARIEVGPLQVGPVKMDLKVSKTSFHYRFDGQVGLGPAEVELLGVRVGAELQARAHIEVSLSGLDIWIQGKVRAWVAVYVPHDICVWGGFVPYPCEWDWEESDFSFTLGKTGIAVNASGLTLSFGGYELTLPFGSDDASELARHRIGGLPLAEDPVAPVTSAPPGDERHPYVVAPPTDGVVETPLPEQAPTIVQLDSDRLAVLEGRAEGAWSSVASLPSARLYPTVVGLADGRVLMAGGAEGTTPTATSAIYDPVADTWTDVDDLDTARAAAGAALLDDGRVLVVGGQGVNGPLASAEVFDPATGTWSDAGDTSVTRHHPSVVRLADGRVLVTGGLDANEDAIGTTEVYDPDAGTWTVTDAVAEPRRFAATGRLGDGSVLVAGGMGANGPLASVERWDPTSGSWSTVAPLDAPRIFDAAATLDDGRLLIAGYDDHGVIYDGDTDTWTDTGMLVAPQPQAAAITRDDGTVLLIGGSADGASVATTQVFDPQTGRWQAAEGLPDAVGGAAAVPLSNGSVFVAGGAHGTEPTAQAAVFSRPGAAAPEVAAVSDDGNTGAYVGAAALIAALIAVVVVRRKRTAGV